MIGSGPAGLAAAQQLTRAGHTVAVYERADKIGGLLRYGIPEFKMEKKHLDRRLDQMRREGTVFRAGVDVGGELTGDQLRDRYDAVVLAIGATAAARPAGPRARARRHPPGDGVPAAVQPGRRSARRSTDQITADGKDVVIIGGGDTGADCLGTSTRQGARVDHAAGDHARAAARTRPAGQPWPTYPMTFRVSSAHEEAGDRVYAVSTQEFLGDDDGNVRALRLVEVASRTASSSRVEGTEREIPAELVLLRDGLHRPGAGRASSSSSASSSTSAATSRATRRTPPRSTGVFVAGDAGRGQSLIVWAIAEGRAAAAAVDAYLTGSTTLPAPIPPTDRPLVV